MPLIQLNLMEQVSTPTQKKEIVTKLTDATVAIKEQKSPSWASVDLEDVLSEEWEIGGLAMSTDAIRELVAGE